MHLDAPSEKNHLQAKGIRPHGEVGSELSRVNHLEDELTRVTRGIREAMWVLQAQTWEGSASKNDMMSLLTA